MRLPLGLAFGLALGLAWAGGGGASLLLSKWRGFLAFLGAWGGVGIGGSGGEVPFFPADADAAAAPPADVALPSLLPHSHPTPALPVHAPPPLLPASRLPNPYKHREGHVGVIHRMSSTLVYKGCGEPLEGVDPSRIYCMRFTFT